MKSYARSLMAALLCAVCAAGCATMKGPTDEEMIQTTLSTVKTALEGKDVKLLMTTFTKDYADPRVGDRATIEKILSENINSSYTENGKVTMEDMKLTFSDDKKSVKVYPIDLSSVMGAVSVEIVLAKTEEGWLISGVNPDGV